MNTLWKDIIWVELGSVTKQRHECVGMYPVNVEFQKTGGFDEVSPSEYVAINIKRNFMCVCISMDMLQLYYSLTVFRD